jgi:hypothetical protein
MLTQAGLTALAGIPNSLPFSLPFLLAALLIVGLFVSLVFMALRRKDNVQAGLQLRPWSITFSLGARNGERKIPPGADDEHAPKAGKSASNS